MNVILPKNCAECVFCIKEEAWKQRMLCEWYSCILGTRLSETTVLVEKEKPPQIMPKGCPLLGGTLDLKTH